MNALFPQIYMHINNILEASKYHIFNNIIAYIYNSRRLDNNKECVAYDWMLFDLCWIRIVPVAFVSWTWIMGSSSEESNSDSDSYFFNCRWFSMPLLLFWYLTFTFSRMLWPRRRFELCRSWWWPRKCFLFRIKKLSVTQNNKMLTQNGIRSITIITSSLGFLNGDNIKFLTSFHISIWIMSAVSNFTIIISRR